MSRVTVAVVIPVYNEAYSVVAVIKDAISLDAEGSLRVILVDDGSSDQSARLASDAGAAVIRHRKNLGKGTAMRNGCDAALRAGAEAIVVMDGDGQHRPQNIPSMVAPIRAGEADVCLGSRQRRDQMPLPHRLANWLLNTWLTLLFGVRVADSQCGMRAFSSSAYKQLRWSASGYVVESEMLVRMTRAKLRYVEAPIETIYHRTDKGATPGDGFRIVWRLLKWRLCGIPDPLPSTN